MKDVTEPVVDCVKQPVPNCFVPELAVKLPTVAPAEVWALMRKPFEEPENVDVTTQFGLVLYVVVEAVKVAAVSAIVFGATAR